MDKEDRVCVYTVGYYSVMTKNESLPFATVWMDSEGILLSETSQKDRTA